MVYNFVEENAYILFVVDMGVCRSPDFPMMGVLKFTILQTYLSGRPKVPISKRGFQSQEAYQKPKEKL